MKYSTRISIDLAKTTFQVCFSDKTNHIQSNKKIKRDQLRHYLHQFEPTLVVMEACYSSHYWLESVNN